MKKLLFFLLVSMSASSLFGEYILYKTSEEKIIALDQDEHEKAFEILIKYQFPMSLNFFHGTDKKDWTKDHWDLMHDEEKFIQNKLDELKLEIKIVFIPTTLYELFFLNFFYEEREEKDSFWDKNKTSIIYGQELKKLNNSWDEKKFLQASQIINKSTRDIHHDLNKKIIGHLKDDVLKIDALEQAKTILNAIKKQESTELYLLLHDCEEENLPEKIILTCIESEIKAHEEKKWLLYRGSFDKENKTKYEKDMHTNSYGNTLFSGVLSDCDTKKGATVYPYFITVDNAYCFEIKKIDYCLKSIPYEFYYIAPFGIAGLFLDGEDFHCRSKVHPGDLKLDEFNNLKLNGRIGPARNLPQEYLITPATSKYDHDEFDEWFQDYENDNRIVINEKYENDKKRSREEREEEDNEDTQEKSDSDESSPKKIKF